MYTGEIDPGETLTGVVVVEYRHEVVTLQEEQSKLIT
jgi:hypothetical protein